MSSIRAACHVHSDWSYDGKWSLERLAAEFSKRGYQAILTTEHDQGFSEDRRLEHRAACQKASSQNILVIPGIEYSDKTNTVHLLVWGDVPFIGNGMAPEDIISVAKDAGGIVVMAHPSRREAWKQYRSHWKSGLLGIEYWNRKTDGWAPSKEAMPLLEQSQAMPFVGMDFHTQKQFFPLATVIQVEPPVTEVTVLNSMAARRCHAEAFNRPVMKFSEGAGVRFLNNAESFRRRLASLYHKIAA